MNRDLGREIVPEHKPGEHNAGFASLSHGPLKLTPEHLKKTKRQLPALVPPPDAEMHPTEAPKSMAASGSQPSTEYLNRYSTSAWPR